MLRVNGCWKLDRSSQPFVSPTSVLDAKYSVFPFLSNTGKRESAVPSVICDSFPFSTEYTNTVCKWFSRNFVYVSHLLSGDQAGFIALEGSSNRSVVAFTGTPFSTSTNHKFNRLSVYAIFLLSGDHNGW